MTAEFSEALGCDTAAFESAAVIACFSDLPIPELGKWSIRWWRS